MNLKVHVFNKVSAASTPMYRSANRPHQTPGSPAATDPVSHAARHRTVCDGNLGRRRELWPWDSTAATRLYQVKAEPS